MGRARAVPGPRPDPDAELDRLPGQSLGLGEIAEAAGVDPSDIDRSIVRGRLPSYDMTASDAAMRSRAAGVAGQHERDSV